MKVNAKYPAQKQVIKSTSAAEKHMVEMEFSVISLFVYVEIKNIFLLTLEVQFGPISKQDVST